MAKKPKESGDLQALAHTIAGMSYADLIALAITLKEMDGEYDMSQPSGYAQLLFDWAEGFKD